MPFGSTDASSRCDGRDVVVVDDHADTADMFAETLALAGARARSFTGAPEALDAILSGPPDVVITDLVMPRMSGCELARRLRACARTAELPVIAISGSIDPGVPVIRLFDAFLFKPADPDLLPALVEMLARRGPSKLRRTLAPIVRGRRAREE